MEVSPGKKLVNGLLAAETNAVIVDDDGAARSHAVVEIVQAAHRGLIPVAIDPKKRDLANSLFPDRQGVLKPAWNQGD